jgi:hypothetical protein
MFSGIKIPCYGIHSIENILDGKEKTIRLVALPGVLIDDSASTGYRVKLRFICYFIAWWYIEAGECMEREEVGWGKGARAAVDDVRYLVRRRCAPGKRLLTFLSSGC